MKHIIISIIFAFIGITAAAEYPDSMIVVLRSDSNETKPLSREVFMRSFPKEFNHKIPAFMLDSEDDILELSQILTAGYKIKDLKYNAKSFIRSIPKTADGDYSIEEGFKEEDYLNVYGLVICYRKGDVDLIWVGKNEIELQNERRYNHGVYNAIRKMFESIWPTK